MNVLANVSAGSPYGGILTVVNFTKPAADGSMVATASIRTLNPCGGGSSGLATAKFQILKVWALLLTVKPVVEHPAGGSTR